MKNKHNLSMNNKKSEKGKKIQKEDPQNKLKLDTSGFSDSFLQDYDSISDFKEKSGFFYKHYLENDCFTTTSENDFQEDISLECERYDGDHEFIVSDKNNMFFTDEKISLSKPFRNTSKMTDNFLKKDQKKKLVIEMINKVKNEKFKGKCFCDKNILENFVLEIIEKYSIKNQNKK